MKKLVLFTLALLFLFAGIGCSPVKTEKQITENMPVNDLENTIADGEDNSNVSPLFYFDSSDFIAADFFSGMSEVAGLAALTGGNAGYTSSKSASRTKQFFIGSEAYEAEYVTTLIYSGDPEAENILSRYGCYDQYRIRTDGFFVGLDYLSGTDIIAGYSYFSEEWEPEDVEISIEEAKTVFADFIKEITKIDLKDYTVIREIEDSDGSYCFVCTKVVNGFETNDTLVVGVMKNGSVYGLSAKWAGISDYFTIPSESETQAGIEAIIRYMNEKFGEKAEDTGARKIHFGNDGRVFVSVKFSIEQESSGMKSVFEVYKEI